MTTNPQTSFGFKKKPVILIVIGVVFLCLLISCCLLIGLFINNNWSFNFGDGGSGIPSFSEPSDKIILPLLEQHLGVGNPNTSSEFQPTNISVVSKGNCDSLSSTAKASGISEAWIIGYDYDYQNNGNYRDGNALLVKQNGSWEIKRTAICP